jgi:hypothetical protein
MLANASSKLLLACLLRKSKFRGTCLKPLLLTILTRSLSLYYQNDERAKAGNLLTNDAQVKVTLRPTISRSISPGFEAHLGLVTGY